MVQDIESLYATAYNLYENGKYSEAVSFFHVLTVANKDEKKFWIGLGASYQMLKDYNLALQSYGYAAFLDENDPVPHFHAAECFISLDKIKEGSHVLEIAKTVALSDPKRYDYILTRIDLLQNSINTREDN